MKIKTLLTALFLAGASAGAGAASRINLNTEEGNTAAMRKILCSTEDGKVSYWQWKGKAYSRRMGEADKHLFNVEGMSARACDTIDGGVKGKTYKLVTREILLYTDPKTGEPMDNWENPFSGEKVDVVHVTNDPVNQGPSFPRNEEGVTFPWKKRFMGEVDGPLWSLMFDVPLFYHNVLGGDYQKQIGGVYHATEMFEFSGDTNSLLNEDFAHVHVDWIRVSDWLPWMMMTGREGMIYFHASGYKQEAYEDLSPVLKAFIENHAPAYKTAPPLDDERANETSWSTYKDDVQGAPFKKSGH
ncbi:DUF1838 family protein [Aestuariibacter sp. A3R04]|uniref:DUF1838 family protein n=1 Tax=Aestuariibacter sp. A3R04 TaxID=2841571 RepID=UPI001C08D017|nr:DUF1838 family protein [Aestuariibacter sp. A3R04]MBU3023511.1 DUF1838 domain-containing protein [Aestuariibacter sp. A3R04]